jgi:hypothetical protein
MDLELQKWIFNSSIFNVPVGKLLSLGFLSDLNDIEYTHGRGAGPHRYFEGYFHGLTQSTPHLKSNHPRYGYTRALDKPAASPELRAFLSELRYANPWLTEIALELAAEMRQRRANASSAESASVYALLAAMFSRPEAMFSDLAVQVHFGEAQAPIWHNDGVNSVLHMALSIHGKREVRMLLHRRPLDTPPDEEHLVHRVNGATTWDHAAGRAAKYGQPRKDSSAIDWSKQFMNPMSPGDIYISSPLGFLHGVDYPTCNYADRIIAVQCRLLMTRDEAKAMYEHLDVDDWLHIIGERVTPILQKANLRIPTLADVRLNYEQCFLPHNNK